MAYRFQHIVKKSWGLWGFWPLVLTSTYSEHTGELLEEIDDLERQISTLKEENARLVKTAAWNDSHANPVGRQSE